MLPLFSCHDIEFDIENTLNEDPEVAAAEVAHVVAEVDVSEVMNTVATAEVANAVEDAESFTPCKRTRYV